MPDAHYHSIFQLREIATQLPLIDDIELHFIELPKLKENAVSLEEDLVKWLLFLKGTEKEKWEVLAMNEPQLRKAMDTLEFLSQNDEARRLYEMRQKALHDEVSMLYGAREEGKAEGRAEGKAEGKFEVARNMLGEGIAVSLISRMTGLSEQEIERLQGQQH
ncbi:Rpn family recombination-promoting nuclease/putative transposase [Paenibacillus alba]|uniref:Rpn family recombination-promoting nuclease/putative transposase n=1 Tax=Paenibacillus alba TaxID=1197127 RepID=UPI0015635B9B|nr:Rpn family recombination-promoting nuclease/putative transposase [Paenibacillus alba]NQX71193.1 Rpn family recombination-promoting nuclease/putative transposase [Paenibacillus alba]